jgi:tetratricopeptide (TPR) repeat protein
MNSEDLDIAALGLSNLGKPTLISFLVWLILMSLPFPYPSLGSSGASAVLKQARAEKDPVERVRLLDEALKADSSSQALRSAIYFERGMAHKDLKDYFRAIEDFNSSLPNCRDAVAVLLEKAECLIHVDQLEEASRVLERVMLSRPTEPRSYVLKGMTYEKEGFLSKAEDEYNRALVQDGRCAPALELRAKVRLREGKPRDALEDLNTLNRLDPDRTDVLVTRAAVFVKLKEYSRALEDYDRALSLAEGDQRIVKDKVQVYFKTGRPEKALQLLSSYPAEDPNDVESLVLQARARILLGDYTVAEGILSEVVARKPSHSPAYVYNGVAAMGRKDWDRALSYLNQGITLDPSQVDAYKERAKAFMELGEQVRAVSDLTKAAELDPSDGEIFMLRGLTQFKRMLYDAAIGDFTHALELLPGDCRILYDRAVAYSVKEEWVLALADLEAVLKAMPGTARALSLRGVVHFNMGRPDRAQNDLDRAVQSDPLDPLVWNNRGFFHYKTGDYKGALDNFTRALRLDSNYDLARLNLGLAGQKLEEAAGPASQHKPADQPLTSGDRGKGRP